MAERTYLLGVQLDWCNIYVLGWQTLPVLQVSVMGLKGGVGKTSVTLGLAGAATLRGLATLVIDLDPQGNATSILATHEPSATVVDVLANPTIANLEAALTACEWEVSPGEVDVLPATPELVKFDAYDETRFRPRLSKVLQSLEGYDLILFDLPPSHGALVRDALSVSDAALVVTTPSFFGGQGVDRAVATIEQVKADLNPGLEFAGVLVNRVRSVIEEHQYRQKELARVHGRAAIWSPAIPERAAMQQAESHGVPVQLIQSQGGRELRAIFDQHLDRLLRTYA